MKKLLKSALMVCLLLCMAFGLTACGDKPALNATEWEYGTRQYRLKNSSYSLESECYDIQDNTQRKFSLEEEVKMTEQNISVVRTRKNYANSIYPDSTSNEYYSLEYGTWTYGSLIAGTQNNYIRATVETNLVEPLVLIGKIFGDTPGQFIGSKFDIIEQKGSVYTYKDDDKELSFTFTEGRKNFDTWQVDVDTISFKWTRLINGVDYYEEGQIRFFDINNTTVTVPNEVRMNLFCQDYVVKDNINKLFETSSTNDYLYANYMEEDNYTLVSVRENTNGVAPVIYFGGQMTNVLELPYTVRKGVEFINGERNVFYLDVQSDVISDIKCYCKSQERRVNINDYSNDTKNWPISFYSGEGIGSVEASIITYKVNGVEYEATATTQLSWVLNANAPTMNDTPVCLFYNYRYDLYEGNFNGNRLPNPYTTIVRTNQHIFALNYQGYSSVIPHVEGAYVRENDRLEYGKIFYATKVYVVDISSLEKNNKDYFVYNYLGNQLDTPYVSLKIDGNNVDIIANRNGIDFDVNVVLDRTEGIVSYYNIQN